MPNTLDQINQRFGVPGIVRFEPGQGGLTRAAVTVSGLAGGKSAQAHIYLHGGHVTHYQRTGEPPVLFVSRASAFQAGKPIRGGVPVCFPWFGARAGHPDAPGHGFARLREWDVESVAVEADRSVTLTLLLQWDAQTLAIWPGRFQLRHRVTVGARLGMALEVVNVGSSEIAFEEALHTYLAVSDVKRVRVNGLEGTTYMSKAEGGVSRVQEGPITITGETDRVYQGTRAACVLDDPGHSRRLSVEKTGSETTVVWNPWEARAKAIADLGDNEWPGMLCIETANALGGAVKLAPGHTHAMTASIG